MKADRISIIIPCYNVEKYIDRCLQSIVEQTYPIDKMEIICVNDASTDDTLEILKMWEQKWPDNIMIIDCTENGRQGRARNIGLSNASGEWIAFIDSDDWIEKDYLEYLVGLSDRYPECDVVTCGYVRDYSKELTYIDAGDNDVQIKVLSVADHDGRRSFVRNRELDYAVYSKLIRKDFLIENGICFPEGLAYEDIYWGGLLNMYACKICVTDRKLYHYYVNPASTILSGQAGYHYDMLTVQEELWSEYSRRDLLDQYREEIELEFVYSCALAFWKIIALRFEEPPYSMYLLLCVFTQTHIPNIDSNRYILQGALPEFYTLILHSLFNPLSKNEFIKFADNIKTIGL
ncbi:Glycosyl transferase family 2 [Lachnospiraceae bacterium XBB2008]|nr:Glycosyl transferase family 2 [Lachnospiraceae bacterium XBB2008]